MPEVCRSESDHRKIMTLIDIALKIQKLQELELDRGGRTQKSCKIIAEELERVAKQMRRVAKELRKELQKSCEKS